LEVYREFSFNEIRAFLHQRDNRLINPIAINSKSSKERIAPFTRMPFTYFGLERVFRSSGKALN